MEDDIFKHTFKRCEICEFVSEKNGFPFCLLENKRTGLYSRCDKFKKKTGEHITLF